MERYKNFIVVSSAIMMLFMALCTYSFLISPEYKAYSHYKNAQYSKIAVLLQPSETLLIQQAGL
jgi:hypothetical protein